MRPRQAKKLLTAIIALAIVFQPIGAANATRTLIKSYAVENSVYQACTESERLITSGNYEQARSLLAQAAVNDPTAYSAEVHYGLTRCYFNLKNYDQAIVEARTTLKFDSKFSRARYVLGLCYYNTQRMDECSKELHQFIQTTDDLSAKEDAKQFLKKVVSYKNVQDATKYIAAGKDKEAIKLLNVAAASDPSPLSASVHASLSFALRRSGDTEKSITEGLKALQYDPQDKATTYNLAIAYQDIAKFDEAINYVGRYLSMEDDPEQRRKAESFLTELKQDRGQFNEASNQAADYFDQMKDKSSTIIWPEDRLPLRVYIASGAGVYGYKPVFRSYAIRSFDTWCMASGKKLKYVVVDDPKRADIKVEWTRDELVGSNTGDKRLKAGLTQTKTSGDCLDRAKVSIRTVHAFDPSSTIENGECASTVLHEVGHALGLGHSTLIYDIMYFRSSSKQTGQASKRDKATIAKMYSSFPVVDFVPNTDVASTPVRFLPPPMFTPPKPPEAKTIVPPMFMPPPLKQEKKLEPPMFVPPPVPANEKQVVVPATTSGSNKTIKNVPLFTPPSIGQKKKKVEGVNPPFFTPPPK